MLLGLSENLPHLVEAKFKAAQAAQRLIFSPTELTVIRTPEGVPFQLRYCPALAKKPQPQKEKGGPTKKPDPFDNPTEDLLIANIPTANPSHLLVLNKFPVIAEHFILATKTNKQQTHILEQDDLEATYACLDSWQEGTHGHQKRLFAFFNSGDHSGASQPHRHLQFLPVESMKSPEEADGWELLMDLILQGEPPKSLDEGRAQQRNNSSGSVPALLQHPTIPFTHFALKFLSNPSGPQLLDGYKTLYAAAKQAVDDFRIANPGELELHASEGGALPISYNLAITTSGMAILPRRSGGSTLRRDDGSEIGFIELNGTTLGGTLMVKHEEEWYTLRSKPEKLNSILEAIGVPRCP